jgi:hypothetical protein
MFSLYVIEIQMINSILAVFKIAVFKIDISRFSYLKQI